MRITRIERQEKPGKSDLYVDGAYFCSVDDDILAEIKINEGMSFQKEEFESKLEIIKYKKALRTALFMLSRAWKTAYEIRKRLLKEGYEADTIEKVMAYLKEAGYINDAQYAETFLKSKTNDGAVSKKTLYEKLRQKGIDREIIEEKLEEAEIDESRTALRLAEKKVSGLKGDEREKRQKLYAFLYRKGFNADICRSVTENFFREDEA